MKSSADVTVYCMVATPFDDAGNLDLPSYRSLLERMCAANIGVYLGSGGAGEGHALAVEELRSLYDVGVATCKGRVPVAANPREARTAVEMHRLTSEAVSVGVDLVQLYPLDAGHGMIPTYTEQEHYYRSLLEAIDHPLAISVHVSVGYVTPIDLLVRLAQDFPSVEAINVMGPPLTYFVELQDALGEAHRSLKLYGGDARPCPEPVRRGVWLPCRRAEPHSGHIAAIRRRRLARRSRRDRRRAAVHDEISACGQSLGSIDGPMGQDGLEGARHAGRQRRAPRALRAPRCRPAGGHGGGVPEAGREEARGRLRTCRHRDHRGRRRDRVRAHDGLVAGGVLVGPEGDRFVDEGLGGGHVANNFAWSKRPLEKRVGFDNAAWRHGGRREPGRRIRTSPNTEEWSSARRRRSGWRKMVQVDPDRFELAVSRSSRRSDLGPVNLKNRVGPSARLPPCRRGGGGLTFTVRGAHVDGHLGSSTPAIALSSVSTPLEGRSRRPRIGDAGGRLEAALLPGVAERSVGSVGS